MDKREAVRVPVRVRAQCRADELVIDGTVEDISRSGVFLTMPSEVHVPVLTPGLPTELELDLPGETTLKLAATVVRVEHEPRVGVALCFTSDTERNRRPLANFIMRCHAFS
jgi:hypothetical protein